MFDPLSSHLLAAKYHRLTHPVTNFLEIHNPILPQYPSISLKNQISTTFHPYLWPFFWWLKMGTPAGTAMCWVEVPSGAASRVWSWSSDVPRRSIEVARWWRWTAAARPWARWIFWMIFWVAKILGTNWPKWYHTPGIMVLFSGKIMIGNDRRIT